MLLNINSLTREAFFCRDTNEGHCSKINEAVKYLSQGHVDDQTELVVTLDISAVVTSFATVQLGSVAK